MPNYTVKVLQKTAFKLQPIDSSKITHPNQKQEVAAGKEFALHSYLFDRVTNHYKVALLIDSFNGRNSWYVYAEHVQILKDDVVQPKGAPESPKAPTSVETKCPLF
ncbi:hypothetical protein TUMEXPCC7403_24450 [Tumidithrix helvetica PCC 7403]|uniref:hypothetical protein n=1 Tax=Tumidithrix helvetica TaxID=3457545 RepID=UPI003CB7122E